MRCADCGFESPEGMKFCGQCAAPLKRRCPQCGFENPPGFKFCGECATPLRESSSVQRRASSVQSPQYPAPSTQPPISYTPSHLAERILAEQAAMESRGSPDGERKTITALFADIKGSMALIEDLDPEEARALVDPTLTLMMEAVHRYEGYVVQSTGDGIFAFFGAPLAHEDHPQRALYAALRMQEDMKRYAEQLRSEHGRHLEIRIGINTGEVVLRSIRKDDLRTDYTPISHSTSLAARLESLAPGGSVVVSEQTYKLTEGYFEFKALGAAKVKGVSEPVHLYEVLGAGPLRTRLQVAARRGLVRFVGRRRELEHLQKALEHTKAGHGQIVAVMGEPGVGKSRLFHEFTLLSHLGCLVLETFSISHGKAYAYLPLIDLLKTYFNLTPQDEERGRREKITGKVLTLDRSLEDTLPYLFTLLGSADPASSLQQMDSQIRKRRTLEAIKRLLVRESLNQPLLLIFEDLHWLDTETQAFLALLSESLATTRLLLLVNYRPEYHHEWSNKTYYTQLRLDPLGQEDAQELLTALLGDGEALQPFKQLILEKTEGNPFFIEEIVQEMVEREVLVRDPSGGMGLRLASMVKPISDLHIPTTIQGILTARIDRLPTEEKTLLQTLAVIGKEFSFSLLKQVVKQSDDTLQSLLTHLQTAEFIYEQPAFLDIEYTFKHALTQEVAYNSLLIERRRVIHGRTAEGIEAIFQPKLEDHYGELAHHYSRSGNTEKAVEYLHKAGQQAVQRSAHTEAIGQFTAALELLKPLPQTSERIRRELSLCIALGTPLVLTKGHAAPEVEAIYTRARELCRQGEETPQLFSVLLGLRRFYFVRGELQTAAEFGGQLLTLARRLQDTGLLMRAHTMQEELLLILGEFAQSRTHGEQGFTLYDPRQHRSHIFLFGNDSGVGNRGQAALVLWMLGYPDQAVSKMNEALTLAQEVAHPFDTTRSFSLAALLAHFRKDTHLVRERAETAIALSAEHGFALFSGWGPVLHGWALAENGQAEEGISQIHQGLGALRAIEAQVFGTYWLVLLAEAYGKARQPVEGLKAVKEALKIVENTGERWWEAELYRLKGALTLQQAEARGWRLETSPSPRAASLKPQVSNRVEQEAEGHFLKAIDIARRQQAKSLELRAATSLARLWQSQGKRDEARQMLAEIYGWFTEGFDTKDLQEAKALLTELAEGR